MLPKLFNIVVMSRLRNHPDSWVKKKHWFRIPARSKDDAMNEVLNRLEPKREVLSMEVMEVKQ
jgi:hypothetical protein